MTTPISTDLSAITNGLSDLQIQINSLINAYNSATLALSVSQATVSTQAAQIIALEAQVAALTPPDPAVVTEIGVYNGTFNDAATKTAFGTYPDISTTYAQPSTSQPWLLGGCSAQITNGISPLINVEANTTDTTMLTHIANNDATGQAYLAPFISTFAALAKVNPLVPVYVSLEGECDVRMNHGTITQTPAVVGQALSVFFAAVKAAAPSVRTLAWFGSPTVELNSDANMAAILKAITVTPWAVGMDPYSTKNHSASETFPQTVGSDVSWLKANADYQRMGNPRIVFPEFGVDTSHGDAACATWLTGLNAQLKSLGVTWACLFNRNSSSYSYEITDGSHPLSVAAFSKSLAGA